MNDDGLLDALEDFYDAVPRDRARVEEHGTFVLFLPAGGGYPLYARPRRGGPSPTAADLAAVRRRQRMLGLPEAVEWVHETTPALLPLARASGLGVLEAPLLVLDGLHEPTPPIGVRLRVADPEAAEFGIDLAVAAAVAHVGFDAAGTAVGPEGAAERDVARRPATGAGVAAEAERVRTGRAALVVAESDAGVVGCGSFQRAGDVVELVGVAVLPAARRRGIGAAVTAALARHALDAGARVVFLSAGSDAVARIYGRLGFRRVGTACIGEPAD